MAALVDGPGRERILHRILERGLALVVLDKAADLV